MQHKQVLTIIVTLFNCIIFSRSTCDGISNTYLEKQISNFSNTLYCSDINLSKESQLTQDYISNAEVLEHIQILQINNSNITGIYNNTFKGLEHLQHVALTYVSLHKIDSNAFLNWANLTDLILSYNNLTSIDFYLPPSVEYINISHNKISYIKELQNHPNLVKLDLSYNSIITIESFGPFNDISYLDLSYNNLTNLVNFTWKSDQMLDSLILSHNNIQFVPKNIEAIIVKNLDLSYNNISVFNCSNVTESINLSHNKIIEICNFSIKIKEIDFSFNKIDDIKEQAFNKLEELKSLNLYNNYIEAIHPNAFQDLVNLIYLDLSDNVLVDLPRGLFYHLRKLKKLYVAFNFINQLEHGIFTGLNSLEIFNVSYNRLDNLDAIYSLKYLTELNILRNHIYHLDVDEIKKHLPYLSKIHIGTYGAIACEELMVYVLEFKAKNIIVEKGDSKYGKNINGIYCDSNAYYKFNKQESDSQRMGYIADYLSGISVALIIIIVVLVFVIILISFSLYKVYIKHRAQTEIDCNLHTCSLKLLNENDPLN